MNIELYLEGKLIDIDQVNFPLSKSFQNLSNPTDIITDYSKTISIPMTRHNNRILGNVYRLDKVILSGDTNIGMYFDPTKKIPFKLVYNGDLLMAGYAKYNNAETNQSKRCYNMTLFGTLGDIFQKMRDVVLDEDKLPTGLSKDYILDDHLSGNPLSPIALSNCYEDEYEYRTLDQDPYDNYIIGFAPTYRGLYSDFKSDKIQTGVNTVKPLSEYINEKIKPAYKTNHFQRADETDEEYEDRMNNEIEALGFNDIVGSGFKEYQMNEYRVNQQKPIVYLHSLFEMYQEKMRQLTGYELVLDKSWANEANPYWSRMCYMMDFLSENTDNNQKVNLFAPSSQHQYTDKVNSGRYTTDYICRFSKDISQLDPDQSLIINPHVITVSGKTASRTDGLRYKTLMNLTYKPDQNPPMNAVVLIHISYSTLSGNTKNLYYWSCDRDNPVAYPIDSNYNSSNFVKGEPSISSNSQRVINKFEIQIPSINLGADVNLQMPLTYEVISTTAGASGKESDHFYQLDWNEYINTNPSRPGRPGGSGSGTGNNKLVHKVDYEDPKINNSNYLVEISELSANINWRTNVNIKLSTFYRSSTPLFDVLMQYTKMFGLIWECDDINKKVILTTRDSYFKNYSIEDWTNKIDKSKDCFVEPVSFDSKYIRFNYDEVDGNNYSDYTDRFGTVYGQKTLKTNYDFNSETKDLFKGIKPSCESTKSFLTLNEITKWNTKGNLYNTVDYMSRPDSESTDSETSISINNWYLRGHNITVPTKDIGKSYITADTPYQLNSDFCWISPEYVETLPIEFAKQLRYIPEYNIVYKVGQEYYGCIFNRPNLDFTKDKEITAAGSNYIYDRCWSNYINERYNIQNKKLTCYLDIKEEDWINFRFNKFIKIDNQLFMVNKIIDFNPTNNDTTKVELVQVSDLGAYTNSNNLNKMTANVKEIVLTNINTHTSYIEVNGYPSANNCEVIYNNSTGSVELKNLGLKDNGAMEAEIQFSGFGNRMGTFKGFIRFTNGVSELIIPFRVIITGNGTIKVNPDSIELNGNTNQSVLFNASPQINNARIEYEGGEGAITITYSNAISDNMYTIEVTSTGFTVPGIYVANLVVENGIDTLYVPITVTVSDITNSTITANPNKLIFTKNETKEIEFTSTPEVSEAVINFTNYDPEKNPAADIEVVNIVNKGNGKSIVSVKTTGFNKGGVYSAILIANNKLNTVNIPIEIIIADSNIIADKDRIVLTRDGSVKVTYTSNPLVSKVNILYEDTIGTVTKSDLISINDNQAEVTFNFTGFTGHVGTYKGEIVATNGKSENRIPFEIKISGSNGELFTEPDSLLFHNNSTKSIHVISDSPLTNYDIKYTGGQGSVIISKYAPIKGGANLEITTKGFTNPGSYYATLNISNAKDTIEVPINIIIIDNSGEIQVSPAEISATNVKNYNTYVIATSNPIVNQYNIVNIGTYNGQATITKVETIDEYTKKIHLNFSNFEIEHEDYKGKLILGNGKTSKEIKLHINNSKNVSNITANPAIINKYNDSDEDFDIVFTSDPTIKDVEIIKHNLAGSISAEIIRTEGNKTYVKLHIYNYKGVRKGQYSSILRASNGIDSLDIPINIYVQQQSINADPYELVFNGNGTQKVIFTSDHPVTRALIQYGGYSGSVKIVSQKALDSHRYEVQVEVKGFTKEGTHLATLLAYNNEAQCRVPIAIVIGDVHIKANPNSIHIYGDSFITVNYYSTPRVTLCKPKLNGNVGEVWVESKRALNTNRLEVVYGFSGFNGHPGKYTGELVASNGMGKDIGFNHVPFTVEITENTLTAEPSTLDYIGNEKKVVVFNSSPELTNVSVEYNGGHGGFSVKDIVHIGGTKYSVVIESLHFSNIGNYTAKAIATNGFETIEIPINVTVPDPSITVNPTVLKFIGNETQTIIFTSNPIVGSLSIYNNYTQPGALVKITNKRKINDNQLLVEVTTSGFKVKGHYESQLIATSAEDTITVPIEIDIPDYTLSSNTDHIDMSGDGDFTVVYNTALAIEDIRITYPHPQGKVTVKDQVDLGNNKIAVTYHFEGFDEFPGVHEGYITVRNGNASIKTTFTVTVNTDVITPSATSMLFTKNETQTITFKSKPDPNNAVITYNDSEGKVEVISQRYLSGSYYEVQVRTSGFIKQGKHTATLTVTNGVVSLDVPITIDIPVIAIFTNFTEINLTADSLITVSFTSALPITDIHIDYTGQIGQVVIEKEEQVADNRWEANIRFSGFNFNSGIYTGKIVSTNGNVTDELPFTVNIPTSDIEVTPAKLVFIGNGSKSVIFNSLPILNSAVIEYNGQDGRLEISDQHADGESKYVVTVKAIGFSQVGEYFGILKASNSWSHLNVPIVVYVASSDIESNLSEIEFNRDGSKVITFKSYPAVNNVNVEYSGPGNIKVTSSTSLEGVTKVNLVASGLNKSGEYTGTLKVSNGILNKDIPIHVNIPVAPIYPNLNKLEVTEDGIKTIIYSSESPINSFKVEYTDPVGKVTINDIVQRAENRWEVFIKFEGFNGHAGSYFGNILAISSDDTNKLPFEVNVPTEGIEVNPAELSIINNDIASVTFKSLPIMSRAVVDYDGKNGHIEIDSTEVIGEDTFRVTVRSSQFNVAGIYKGRLRVSDASGLKSIIVPITVTSATNKIISNKESLLFTRDGSTTITFNSYPEVNDVKIKYEGTVGEMKVTSISTLEGNTTANIVVSGFTKGGEYKGTLTASNGILIKEIPITVSIAKQKIYTNVSSINMSGDGTTLVIYTSELPLQPIAVEYNNPVGKVSIVKQNPVADNRTEVQIKFEGFSNVPGYYDGFIVATNGDDINRLPFTVAAPSKEIIATPNKLSFTGNEKKKITFNSIPAVNDITINNPNKEGTIKVTKETLINNHTYEVVVETSGFKKEGNYSATLIANSKTLNITIPIDVKVYSEEIYSNKKYVLITGNGTGNIGFESLPVVNDVRIEYTGSNGRIEVASTTPEGENGLLVEVKASNFTVTGEYTGYIIASNGRIEKRVPVIVQVGDYKITCNQESVGIYTTTTGEVPIIFRSAFPMNINSFKIEYTNPPMGPTAGVRIISCDKSAVDEYRLVINAQYFKDGQYCDGNIVANNGYDEFRLPFQVAINGKPYDWDVVTDSKTGLVYNSGRLEVNKLGEFKIYVYPSYGSARPNLNKAFFIDNDFTDPNGYIRVTKVEVSTITIEIGGFDKYSIYQTELYAAGDKNSMLIPLTLNWYGAN